MTAGTAALSIAGSSLKPENATAEPYYSGQNQVDNRVNDPVAYIVDLAKTIVTGGVLGGLTGVAFNFMFNDDDLNNPSWIFLPASGIISGIVLGGIYQIEEDRKHIDKVMESIQKGQR